MRYRLKPTRVQSILVMLVTGLLCAPQVIGDTRHSLGIEWQRYRETLGGENWETDIHPELLNLHYAYQLGDAWTWATSAWQGKDDKMLEGMSRQWQLTKQLEGISSAVSYQQDQWWLDLGLSYDLSELDVATRMRDSFYVEELETLELFTSVNHDLDWLNGWLTTSLSLAYQKGRGTTRYDDFPFRFTLLTGTEAQNTQGAIVSGNLKFAYPMALNASAQWLPAVSIGWNQPVWGDVVNSVHLRQTRWSVGSNIEQEQTAENELDGNGFIGASVALSFADYFADLSYSEPFDDEWIGAQLSLELGINF